MKLTTGRYFQFFKFFFIIPDSDNRLFIPYLAEFCLDFLGPPFEYHVADFRTLATAGYHFPSPV